MSPRSTFVEGGFPTFTRATFFRYKKSKWTKRGKNQFLGKESEMENSLSLTGEGKVSGSGIGRLWGN
jgi:hypothetical protein